MNARLESVTAAPPGPPEVFDVFYRRELPAMTALAAAITGNDLVAEDLAQEALMRAHRRWDTVGAYDKPGAWLRRVTVNLALSARKRAAAEMRARLRLRATTAMAPSGPQHQPVWDAVAKLPGKQRAAVALHYLEDRPTAEIAEILGCAEATARVHLHRGRQALAAMLEGNDR